MAQVTPETIDYIIAGGGTTGNVIAVRLAERGNSVLVLESGKDISAEPEVRTPGLFALNFVNPDRNWNFLSVPQTNANGRQIFLPRGKGLGGSSNINFMAWNRPSAREFDAFKTLGIDGWSWGDLLPYFLRSERVNISAASGVEAHIEPKPGAHGDSGYVEVTAPSTTLPSRELFFQAMNEAGIETNLDALKGENMGVWNSFQAIDSKGARVSSDTAYLKPNQAQLPNLLVVTEAHVTRVLFATSNGDALVADGVEYIQKDKTHTVKAKKEVILCAGSYHTPQILELSGIGDRSILEKHKIKVLVDSPGVGKNLHEHLTFPMCFQLAAGLDSFDSLREPAIAMEEMKKYQTGEKSKFGVVPISFAMLSANQVFKSAEEKTKFKEALKEASKQAGNPLVAKMVDMQLEWLEDDNVPFVEIMETSAFYPTTSELTPAPDKRYCTLHAALQYPLSRGTVHVTSTDSNDKPEVDPCMLSSKTDLEVLLRGLKFIRDVLSKTKAFENSVVEEVAPGKDVDGDEALKEYIKNNVNVVFHPVGTAAMLPKEMEGVVDKDLMVYGTTNLRVVDASTLPIELSVHPMATLYAMAEKAADIIGGSQ